MNHRYLDWTEKLFAVALAIVALSLAASFSPSCKATAEATARVELMPQADFDVTRARVDLLARVVSARLVAENAASVETMETAATALDFLATDPLATVGPTMLTDALRKAGLSSDEVLLAIVLVEDYVRSRFSWGETTAILGPRARDLIGTVASAIRRGAAGGVTDADQVEANSLLAESE